MNELPSLKTAMSEDKTELVAIFLLASKNVVPGAKTVSLKPFVTCFYTIITCTKDRICALQVSGQLLYAQDNTVLNEWGVHGALNSNYMNTCNTSTPYGTP